MPIPKFSLPSLVAPLRQVVLLSDAHFFARNVPLASGEGADAPAVQAELALETLSPFPVAQLYHGFFSRPGVDRMLVFAAYRKRFPTEETATWAHADLVTPAFAALLSAPAPEGATTWLITGPESLTAVHFSDASGVPASVQVQVLPAEAGEPEHAAARQALLRGLPGSRTVIDLPVPEIDHDASDENVWSVRAGEWVLPVAVEEAEALDVRDKTELANRRAARNRDQWLWRSLVAAVVVIACCAFGELLLFGGRMIQDSRVAQVALQSGRVEQIMTKRSLATRVEELSTRRMLPLEMVSLVNSVRPPNIQLLSSSVTGLYTVQFDAQTPSGTLSDISAFQTALQNLPECENVIVDGPRTDRGVSSFRITVTFNPEMLHPAEA